MAAIARYVPDGVHGGLYRSASRYHLSQRFNLKNSNIKIAYACVLTPSGLREKAKISARFLKQKVRDYGTLTNKIEKLRYTSDI